MSTICTTKPNSMRTEAIRVPVMVFPVPSFKESIITMRFPLPSIDFDSVFDSQFDSVFDSQFDSVFDSVFDC